MADNQLTGLCGEHYVAGFLAGHGIQVALPRGGAQRSDLFIAETKIGRPLRVQVKTARDPYGPWKGQEICSWDTDCGIVDHHNGSLWYAYVGLRGWPSNEALPDVYFVPSVDVAACMATEQGKKRTFFWMYRADAEKYRGVAGVALLKAAFVQACNVTTLVPEPSADKPD